MNIGQDIRDAKVALQNALNALDVLTDAGEQIAQRHADLTAELVDLEARAKTLGPDLDAKAADLDQRITDFDLNSTRKKRAADEREGRLDADGRDLVDRERANIEAALKLDKDTANLEKLAATVKAAAAAIEQRKARMAAA